MSGLCWYMAVLSAWSCGSGSATYWLGAAQHKAGVSWPVGHNDPSHHQRQPVVPELMPIHSGRITRYCRLPCCVAAVTAALKWPLQGASLGRVYGDPGMPSHQDSPLGLTYVVQRNAEQYVWHQLGCRSCWNSAWIQAFGVPLLIWRVYSLTLGHWISPGSPLPFSRWLPKAAHPPSGAVWTPPPCMV